MSTETRQKSQQTTTRRPKYRYTVHEKTTKKQRLFLENEASRRAFIGGRGSGKTYAGVLASMVEVGKGARTGAIIAPTYPMLKDIILPVWKERTRSAQIGFNESAMTWRGMNGSTVLFRSADQPDRLRGLNLSWFWIDEAAFLDRYVWRVLIATLRESEQGRAWITTTPRGKNWVFDVFHDAPPNYFMIQTSSYENTKIPNYTEYLEDLKREYGIGWFEAQEIRGEFVEPEGALYHREWFKMNGALPSFTTVVRGWDLATTTKTTSDYTAGVKIGITEHNDIYVLDVVRGKWEWPDAKSVITDTARIDGTECRVCIETVAFQTAALQELLADPTLGQYVFEGVRADRDKASRALPIAARAKAGKVYLVPGQWNAPFLDELCFFDGSGKGHDDQVDGLSIAYAGADKPEPRVTMLYL